VTYIVAGAPWDSTFAAAVVAGVIGLLTLAGTFVQLIVTRSRLSRFERTLLADQKEAAVRQQHRLELNDGIGYVLGKGVRSREIGSLHAGRPDGRELGHRRRPPEGRCGAERDCEGLNAEV